MKRWLFNVAATLSLLVSLAAVAAWATSYTRPSRWRLVATMHSADLSETHRGPQTILFTSVGGTTVNAPNASGHGFWDAWWARSQSGRLTLLAEVIDYDGQVQRVYASPPSLVVDLPGEPRRQVVVFGRVPHAGPWATRLGFAWHSDAAQTGVGGPVLRAWMMTMPYWFPVLIGLPMPLWWLRVARRRRKLMP